MVTDALDLAVITQTLLLAVCWSCAGSRWGT
jgi:hypothetical protein